MGYLFYLAHFCACPPAAVDALRLLDFARLIDAIDQALAAQPGG